GTGVDMGGLHAALGVVAALVQRARTGRGAYLDASCSDGAIAANLGLGALANLGEVPANISALDMGPRYNVYGTSDHKVIFLCPIEQRFWFSFCEVIGRPDLRDRGRWDGPMDFGHDDPALRDEI